MNRRYFLAGLATLGVISACAKSKDRPQGEPNPSPVEIESQMTPDLKSIQSEFVNKKCLSCHSQPTEKNRFVALSDISQIIAGIGHTYESSHMRRNLIMSGCPKQSLFLSIIKEGKMPPSENVSAVILRTIEEWIVSLKPSAGRACQDDEPPD